MQTLCRVKPGSSHLNSLVLHKAKLGNRAADFPTLNTTMNMTSEDVRFSMSGCESVQTVLKTGVDILYLSTSVLMPCRRSDAIVAVEWIAFGAQMPSLSLSFPKRPGSLLHASSLKSNLLIPIPLVHVQGTLARQI